MALFRRSKKNTEDLVNVEGGLENREIEGLTQGQIVRARFFRHRGAMISIVVLVGIILLVFSSVGGNIFGINYSGWWKWTITDMPDVTQCRAGIVGCPTLSVIPKFLGGAGMHLGQHPFGQDDIGHDYFALVMRGTQRSIIIMFVLGIVAGLVGTVVGAVAGYFKGITDNLLMRLVEFIIIIPVVIVGAVIGYHFGSLGVMVLALMLGLFSWPGLARLVRGEFLSLREREFVDAARVAGASNSRIIFKHILPNAVGVIIVAVTLLMSQAILLESALSFLGFGVVAPDVSLGLLISQYQDSFTTRPWLFWWPGLFIIVICLTVNFIGDGLRDAFDPRQRRRIGRKEREESRQAIASHSVGESK
jgi:peptide/nickel transport system permease protein